MNIRASGNGHSTLYVVNHDGRESIEVFDVNANGIEVFASCHRPFIVKAIDPGTMETRDIVASPALDWVSNITMALPMGNDIWIGTFAGDRVGYELNTPWQCQNW